MAERPPHTPPASPASPRPALVGVPIPRRRRIIIGGGGVTLAVAPMIDIVFLLLMYFLLVGNFLPPEGLFELDLPEPIVDRSAGDPFALPQPPVRVVVRSIGDGPNDCAIRLAGPIDRDIASYDQLYRAMEAARGRLLASDQAFVIQPGPGTHWEHTLGVFNAVLRSGFDRIRFASPAS